MFAETIQSIPDGNDNPIVLNWCCGRTRPHSLLIGTHFVPFFFRFIYMNFHKIFIIIICDLNINGLRDDQHNTPSVSCKYGWNNNNRLRSTHIQRTQNSGPDANFVFVLGDLILLENSVVDWGGCGAAEWPEVEWHNGTGYSHREIDNRHSKSK